jgi:hypothetical protein
MKLNQKIGYSVSGYPKTVTLLWILPEKFAGARTGRLLGLKGHKKGRGKAPP